MDIADTLAPESDQLDAVDLLGGPRVFTITNVSKGNTEQPVQIQLAEFPRVWRPGKSMRRVLAACWGTDGSTYLGRRVELYCDPDVQFGGQSVGGTRIKRLSHIDKPMKVPLLVSRGKSAMWRVEPLPDTAPTSPAVSPGTLAELAATFRRKGIPEDKWLAGANHYTSGAATSLDGITEDHARVVLGQLKRRPDAPSSDDTVTAEDIAALNREANADKPDADGPTDPAFQ